VTATAAAAVVATDAQIHDSGRGPVGNAGAFFVAATRLLPIHGEEWIQTIQTVFFDECNASEFGLWLVFRPA
jgi:hypothetical protein